MTAILNSLIAILLLFIPAGMTAAEEGGEDQCQWLYNMDEAKAEATATSRPILISFSGSDWCVPCMRLDRDLFSTAAFAQFSADHLVLLKLDFPARKRNALSAEQLAHNEELAEAYNQSGAFPLVVITDADGDVLGQMAHPLSSAEAYIQSLRSIIGPPEK
jgi:thioredoxin-related protein